MLPSIGRVTARATRGNELMQIMPQSPLDRHTVPGAHHADGLCDEKTQVRIGVGFEARNRELGRRMRGDADELQRFQWRDGK